MVHVFSDLEDTGDDLPPMCDMTFAIVAKAYDEHSSSWRLSFQADATPYEPVGFDAVVPVVGWREQIDSSGNDDFQSYWGSVTLYSRGAESDRLLALMADYYNIFQQASEKASFLQRIFGHKDNGSTVTWKFATSIACSAVGIASNPALIADDVLRMKLFLEDGIEDGRYAEIFFDIDMPEGFAALNEKDESYRADLVHWLSLEGDVVANLPADQR